MFDIYLPVSCAQNMAGLKYFSQFYEDTCDTKETGDIQTEFGQGKKSMFVFSAAL